MTAQGMARCILLVMLVHSCAIARDNPSKWIHISSTRFSLLTDDNEARGHEVLVRFEQMRTEFGDLLNRGEVRLPVPLDIIAFKTGDEYMRVAPAGQSTAGFFLRGEDRNFIVLNLGQPESWRAVSHDFALALLDGNYPPAQPWFDEGFAEYFSSLRPGDKQSEIGNDPSSGQFTAQLSKENWMSIGDLFATKPSQSDVFRAQAWITMRYLIEKNKLSEVGQYLGLVKMQKLPVDQAVQQAFGMDTSALGQVIREYFQSLSTKFASNAAATVTATDAEVVGSSLVEMKPGEAQAAVAEMILRVPGRTQFAEKEIQNVTSDPKLDNSIAHRALGWEDIQKSDYDAASEQLNQAVQLDPRDPWVRYYFCLLKYKKSQNGTKEMQGLPNMLQDLRIVLDWNPEFAEAYNMLGIARLQGGGINAAMESMHGAIQLGPRREDYLLNMANIYLSGKKWDAATELLNRLEQSSDSEIVSAAQKKLSYLPALKKYGRVPEEGPGDTAASGNSAPAVFSSPPESDEVQVGDAEAVPPPPDKRPILHAKGQLLSVDCTHSPVALLTVSTPKKLVLRTEDFKSMVVIGADGFSCDWRNRGVSMNYKPGGKSDGDLVSLELR